MSVNGIAQRLGQAFSFSSEIESLEFDVIQNSTRNQSFFLSKYCEEINSCNYCDKTIILFMTFLLRWLVRDVCFSFIVLIFFFWGGGLKKKVRKSQR